MTVYKIFIRNKANGTKTFDHIKDTTNRAERNQIIRENTANGKNITVVEVYSNGITCRCEYEAREQSAE